jgi:hypothetical protein
MFSSKCCYHFQSFIQQHRLSKAQLGAEHTPSKEDTGTKAKAIQFLFVTLLLLLFTFALFLAHQFFSN